LEVLFLANATVLDTWYKYLLGSYRTVERMAGVKRPVKLTDIWLNCGLTVKRAQDKPLLPYRISERKRDYGRDILLHLPIGLSDHDFYRKLDKLFWAFNAEIELEPVNGKLLIRVMSQQLKNTIPYCDPAPPGKMETPVLIGYSRCGEEWLNICDIPHVLIAGLPGSGKSMLLHSLCLQLITRVELYVIDLKRLEFSYLRGVAEIATTEKEALSLLVSLNKEMNRRLIALENAGVTKIQEYPGDDMPFVVLVIDELAELTDDKSHEMINRLLRLSRACGISIVAASQRVSVNTISGDSRANFGCKISFRVGDELNSRMILGEGCSRAAYLPTAPGRCIVKHSYTREVQTMYLPIAEAKLRLNSHNNSTKLLQRATLSNA
jgi:S-DNA-T family DNA segregation ATPase FtsK/SpoIIIE